MDYITVENLTKIYGSGDSSVTALAGLSLSVAAGEFMAVMGESGSGKSTLLAVMGALNTPTNGTVQVDGIDVYALDQDQRAEFRQEFLGFVFQSFHLIPYLTVLENVMLPLATKRQKGSTKSSLARDVLVRVGLDDKRNRLPGEISGGEQERVALARAVVNRPPILLADEPTGNLDTKTTQEVMALFQHLNAEGTTIVMVTHSPECSRHARRLLHLQDGSIVAGEDPVESENQVLQEKSMAARSFRMGAREHA